MEIRATYNDIKVGKPLSLFKHNYLYIPDNFDTLADLIAKYPLIAKSTHFVFIPGPLDLALNSTLPRMPLMSTITTKLRAKVPKIHFGTNPCRIKFFNQELVIFREDLMSRMLRNMVGVKPNAQSEDLKRFVREAPDISRSFPLENLLMVLLARTIDS